jgi:hypothetical protein
VKALVQFTHCPVSRHSTISAKSGRQAIVVQSIVFSEHGLHRSSNECNALNKIDKMETRGGSPLRASGRRTGPAIRSGFLNDWLKLAKN